MSESYYTASGTLTRQISYDYDLLGNRTKVTESQTGTTTYGYDKANQLTTKNGISTYTYDAVGNLTGDGTYTYVYNVLNQLTQVKQGSTVIAQYEYNADGLRTKKVANGKTERYYYNGTHLVYITDQNNKTRLFFTRDAAGRLLNMIDYTGATPTTYWYGYDAHGNVVGLADKTGAAVVTYSYDAWGNLLSSSGTIKTGEGQLLVDANSFRYSGYQFDSETGLYYLKARYYSPTLGRFLTRDVVADNNLYAYCGNNPTNLTDHNGLDGDRDRGDAGAYDSSRDMVNGVLVSESRTARGIGLQDDAPNSVASPLPISPSPVVISSPASAFVVAGVGQNHRNGRNAEFDLAMAVGATATQAYVRVGSLGKRYMDVVVDTVGYEVKVGLVRATEFIQAQIAKDAQLLKDGIYDEIYWVFYRSPVTGMIGPVEKVSKLLDTAKIKLLYR